MDLKQFMQEMDIQAPDWYIDLASNQDLKTFVRKEKNDISRHTDNLDKLRTCTGSRLFICARATYNGIERIS